MPLPISAASSSTREMPVVADQKPTTGTRAITDGVDLGVGLGVGSGVRIAVAVFVGCGSGVGDGCVGLNIIPRRDGYVGGIDHFGMLVDDAALRNDVCVKIHPDINEVALKREELFNNKFDEVCNVVRDKTNRRAKHAKQPLPNFINRWKTHERVRRSRNSENAEE